MSNEYKDWIWDKLQDVVLEAGVIDKILQVIPYDNIYGVVHGIKDGYHVQYNVWFDDDEGKWAFERMEGNK